MEFKILEIKKDFIKSEISKNLDLIKIESVKEILSKLLLSKEHCNKIVREIAEHLLISYEEAYFQNNNESSSLKTLLYSEDKTTFGLDKFFKSRIESFEGENEFFVKMFIEPSAPTEDLVIGFIIEEMVQHVIATIKTNEEGIKETIVEVSKSIVEHTEHNFISMLKNDSLQNEDRKIIIALVYGLFGAETVKLGNEFIEGI